MVEKKLADTRRIGLGWKAFNSMSSMLCGKTHMEYQRTCKRPVVTYGSKAWMMKFVE